MINFIAVDFSERRSDEEVNSFFWRSVYKADSKLYYIQMIHLVSSCWHTETRLASSGDSTLNNRKRKDKCFDGTCNNMHVHCIWSVNDAKQYRVYVFWHRYTR